MLIESAKKILTIIVPSYNMEQFLPNCLDSLIVKNYLELLEVIVVNDGSKDRTSDIAHDYELRYPSVFRVIDKLNGNYGSCINRGLAEANGEYVKILDADDSFDTLNFDEFIHFLSRHDSDLILSDFVTVDTVGNTIREYKYHLSSLQSSVHDVCMSPNFVNMEMHAVTYRTALLKNIRYRQIEGISYTDQQWIFEPMANVNTVMSFDKVVYRYLLGREGQTMDMSIRVNKFADNVALTKRMILVYPLLCEVNASPNLLAYLLGRLQLNIHDVYTLYFSNNENIDKKIIFDFDSFLKQNLPELYNYNVVNRIWHLVNKSDLLDKCFCFAYKKLFKLLY